MLFHSLKKKKVLMFKVNFSNQAEPFARKSYIFQLHGKQCTQETQKMKVLHFGSNK